MYIISEEKKNENIKISYSYYFLMVNDILNKNKIDNFIFFNFNKI